MSHSPVPSSLKSLVFPVLVLALSGCPAPDPGGESNPDLTAPRTDDLSPPPPDDLAPSRPDDLAPRRPDLPGEGCDGGMTRCNGLCIDTSNDVANCGACNVACSAAHGRAACVGGACRVGACDPGWGDCDGLANNGCEADLGEVGHCGACGVVCAGLPHAAPACTFRVCGLGACEAPFQDCNQLPGDGCEVDVSSDPLHCGRCGTTCVVPGAVAGCVAGKCTLAACAGGALDCDKMAGNGCECRPPHAAPLCNGAACALGACDGGWGDCDNQAGNGCETNLSTDVKNCGACGVACPNGQACNAGKCGAAGVTAFGRFFPQVSCPGANDLRGTAADGEPLILAEPVWGQGGKPDCIDLPGGGVELRAYNLNDPFLNHTTIGIFGANHAVAPNFQVPELVDRPELQNLATTLGYAHYQVVLSEVYGSPRLQPPLKSQQGFIDNNGLYAYDGNCCIGVKFVLDIKFLP